MMVQWFSLSAMVSFIVVATMTLAISDAASPPPPPPPIFTLSGELLKLVLAGKRQHCSVSYDAGSVSLPPLVDNPTMLHSPRATLLEKSSCLLLITRLSTRQSFSKEMSDLRLSDKVMVVLSHNWTDPVPREVESFDVVLVNLGSNLPECRFRLRHTSEWHGLKDVSPKMDVMLPDRPLRLSLIEDFPPFIIKEGSQLGGIDVLTWRVITQRLAVQYQFVVAKNHKDTVDMTKRGEADFSMLQLILNENWYRSAQSTPAMHVRELNILGAYPRDRSRLLSLVDPFDWRVWLAWISAVVTMCISLVLISRSFFSSEGEHDFFLLSATALGVTINEGLPERLLRVNGVTASVQFLLASYIPMACLVGMAYQSNLLAALVKSGKEKPIDTYQDIIDMKLTLYVMEATLVPHLLSTSPIPVVREAYQKGAVEGNGLYSVNDYVNGEMPPSFYKKIADHKAVVETISTRHVSARHYLRRARHMLIGNFHCGYYHGMNNPFAPRVDRVAQRIVDGGIFAKIKGDVLWRRALPEREHERRVGAQARRWEPLGVGGLVPAMILFGATVTLAFASFGFELVYFK